MTAPSYEDYLDAQRKEYSQFVAVTPIFVGGARAFNPGHPVPASHVDANPDWLQEGLVRKAEDDAVGAHAAPDAAPAAAPAPVVPAPEGEPVNPS